MDKKLEPIVKAVQTKFGATFEEFRDEVHLFVKPEQIVEALTLLRDEQNFELLSALTAVDYHPQSTPRFHVIYQLTSIAKNLSVQLRVPVNGASPKVPTVAQLYKQEWFSVETVISEHQVRDLVPRLKKSGAEGIIEYSLNKVI